MNALHIIASILFFGGAILVALAYLSEFGSRKHAKKTNADNGED